MLILLIDRCFLIYSIMLFVRIMASWVPEFSHYRVMQFIAFCTDPYLDIFRRIIPPMGMIDISPIFAFLSLSVIEYFTKWCATWLLL